MNTTIQQLHNSYCSLSGHPDIALSMSRIFQWECWLAKGWTDADLRMVINWTKRQIADKRKWPSALIFSRLIQDTEGFEEALSMARSDARTPKVNPGLQQVLVCTGRASREQTVPITVRSAADVLKGEQAFKDFVALKGML